MRRKMAKRFAPSEAAASSMSAVELLQHGLDGADDERQRHEQERHHDRDPSEGDVDPDRAHRPVEREQRQPRDDRWQREREVDERVDEALARELVAHEHPRDRRAGDRVDRGDDEGAIERELDRRDRFRRGDRLPEAGEAPLVGLPDECREREEDDHGQVARDHPDPKADQSAGAAAPAEPTATGSATLCFLSTLTMIPFCRSKNFFCDRVPAADEVILKSLAGFGKWNCLRTLGTTGR